MASVDFSCTRRCFKSIQHNLRKSNIYNFMNLSIIFVIGFLILSNSSIHTVHGFPYPTSTELDMSFKRLESGENSDETTNQCCARESKFLTIGYGLDSDELRVDVGYCRQTCETTKIKPLKREEFDKFLKKYPDIDPIQIFLSLQQQYSQNSNNNRNGNNDNGNVNGNGGGGGDRLLLPLHQHRNSNSNNNSSHNLFKLTSKSSTSSCISSTCQPTLLRREKLFTLAGGFQKNSIDIIESCDCITTPSTCSRIPLQITIHAATPYEKIIDVGQCSGPCSNNVNDAHSSSSSCKSIRNKTISIDGPNGQECIETMQECSCVGECFRSREFLKVFDYTLIVDESTTSTRRNNNNGAGAAVIDSNVHNSTDNNVIDESLLNIETSETIQLLKEPVIKMIDIGRCGGTCHNTQVSSKCLLWNENNTTCLSSLYGGQNQCVPTKFLSHFYTDKVGHTHNIFSIISCGCR